MELGNQVSWKTVGAGPWGLMGTKGTDLGEEALDMFQHFFR